MGPGEECSLGCRDGTCDGIFVGASVGGCRDGTCDGVFVGASVGRALGREVGAELDGLSVGCALRVGDDVGLGVGGLGGRTGSRKGDLRVGGGIGPLLRPPGISLRPPGISMPRLEVSSLPLQSVIATSQVDASRISELKGVLTPVRPSLL